MSTQTELQTKLTPEAMNVLALAGNLSPQERLELTSNMLSDLAYAMEPKDRLTLAAALVKQAVQRIGPEGLAEMTRRIPRRRCEVVDKVIQELCRGEPNEHKIKHAHGVPDSLTLRGTTFDVMLVALDKPKPNLQWMHAARAVGYRIGTHEENITEAKKLLDKKKKMEIEMARDEISKLQKKIDRWQGSNSPSADTSTGDTSNLPNRYEREAFDIYVNKQKIWGPVRDLEGIVWIRENDGNYDISTTNCCFLSQGRIENVHLAEAHASSLMLLVRESQEQEE